MPQGFGRVDNRVCERVKLAALNHNGGTYQINMRPSAYNLKRKLKVEPMARQWDDLIAWLADREIFPFVLFRILLFGISRAGKSRLGETLFPENFERVAFHREMQIDDLVGGIDPRAVGRPDHSPWLDGPALRALKHGKIVIFDEINECSAECRPFLHALMDDPPAVTINTGERIQAAKGYGVIATTNAMPNELPLPIFERFDVVLRVTELSSGLVKSLGDFANPAKVAASHDAKRYMSWQRPVSINMWIAAAKLRKKGICDDQIADSLGLHGQDKNDFLTAIGKKCY